MTTDKSVTEFEAKVYTGEEGNGSKELVNRIAPTGAMANVEQARAIAEVQAAMYIAKNNPRDVLMAWQKIIKACKRPALAESASYYYKRGSTAVTGVSIRLAEVLAQNWGNMTYGFRELSRDNTSSEVEAFAWDLETNTKAVRQFQIKHWRDTNQGGYQLREERDKYELIANQAQRRVRACILEIIPGDIIDSAELECKRTVEEAGDFDERKAKLIKALAALNITVEMIEARLEHSIAAMIPQELVGLNQIGRSITDKVAQVEEFFDIVSSKPAPKKKAHSPTKGIGGIKPDRAEEKKAPVNIEPVTEQKKVDDVTITHSAMLTKAEANHIVVKLGKSWDELPLDMADYVSYEEMLDDLDTDWRKKRRDGWLG